MRCFGYAVLTVCLLCLEGCPDLETMMDSLRRCDADFDILRKELHIGGDAAHCSAVKDFLVECVRSVAEGCPDVRRDTELLIYNTVRIYIHQYVPEKTQNNMAAVCGDHYFDPEEIKCGELSLVLHNIVECTKPFVRTAALLPRNNPQQFCSAVEEYQQNCIASKTETCPMLRQLALGFVSAVTRSHIRQHIALDIMNETATACGLGNVTLLTPLKPKENPEDRCPLLVLRVRRLEACHNRYRRQLNDNVKGTAVCQVLRDYMTSCVGDNIVGCPKLVYSLHKFLSFPVSLRRQLEERCGSYSMMIALNVGGVARENGSSPVTMETTMLWWLPLLTYTVFGS